MRDKPAADPILNDMEYILPRVSFNQQPLKGSNQNLLDKQTLYCTLPFKTFSLHISRIQREQKNPFPTYGAK
jgi:hypothetical protein